MSCVPAGSRAVLATQCNASMKIYYFPAEDWCHNFRAEYNLVYVSAIATPTITYSCFTSL